MRKQSLDQPALFGSKWILRFVAKRRQDERGFSLSFDDAAHGMGGPVREQVVVVELSAFQQWPRILELVEDGPAFYVFPRVAVAPHVQLRVIRVVRIRERVAHAEGRDGLRSAFRKVMLLQQCHTSADDAGTLLEESRPVAWIARGFVRENNEAE